MKHDPLRFTPVYEGLALRMACAWAAQRWQSWIAEGRGSGPFRVVEIGVGAGVSANEMVGDLNVAGIEYAYCGVEDGSDERSQHIACQWPHMTVLHGNSHDPRLAEQVPGGLHFLYIDGDHSYAGARADVELWAPKLRPGFLMAMHDVHTTGAAQVYQALLASKQWQLVLEVYQPIGNWTPGIAILERT